MRNSADKSLLTTSDNAETFLCKSKQTHCLDADTKEMNVSLIYYGIVAVVHNYNYCVQNIIESGLVFIKTW